MKRLTLMLITNDVAIAAYAVGAGVDRIFVDLEVLGKEERQGHLDTHKASHTPEDVGILRKKLPDAEILARINPLHAQSAEEIDAVIEHGADLVMLPMFVSPEEVAQFIEMVDCRAGVSLLLETPQALARVDEILLLHDRIDEVHVGLNDLHLGMGLDFMFELLAGGLVEFLGSRITARGIRFGFGGIARVGEGTIPAELIIGEHVRIGSQMAILSRSFHQRATNLADLKSRLNLPAEIDKVRRCEQQFRNGSSQLTLEANRELLLQRVRTIGRGIRADRPSTD